MTTSSTPIAEIVDSLAEHIKASPYTKFGELANYLEARGIDIDGDEELTGENLRQPHVIPGPHCSGRLAMSMSRSSRDDSAPGR